MYGTILLVKEVPISQLLTFYSLSKDAFALYKLYLYPFKIRVENLKSERSDLGITRIL